MLRFGLLLLAAVRAAFLARTDLVVENLALRHQLSTFVHCGRRPRVGVADRVLWVTLRRVWARWSEVLLFVRPETVVRWHRAGFRKYWTWLSHHRRREGRPSIDGDLRTLILRMAAENPSWGAPRIHGELLMLGIDVSERTVSRYLPRRRPAPGALERWIVFLRNHRGAIAAMDFFTVPTVAFRVLHVWFAIDHARRRILHFDVTEHPIADWVVQQLRETFPLEGNLRHLVFDRDASFGERVASMVELLGLRPTRTAYRSPWQNGVAERWIGSVRRELLDQVVVLNERHLRRLLNEYVAYYHDDRTHDALAKETPAGRRPAVPQVPCSTAVSRPRLGGLHHRYEAAA